MSKIYLNNIRFIHYMKIYRDGIINMANVILFAILDTKGEADMSIIKAKEYLKSVGYEDRVIEFAESTATVAEAAEAVGVEPAMEFWTLDE